MKFAIVGKAAILPNIESFTDILKTGKDNKQKANNTNNESNIRYYYDNDINKYFNPDFFGYTTKETETMDDQHKALIYLSWKALNSYGFLNDSKKLEKTGVITSVSTPDIMFKRKSNLTGSYSSYFNNIPDTAPTKISYKFNLRGPSINVSSACSSSLSALKTAQLYLKNEDMDMALVGSAKVNYLAEEGYQYVDGGVFSKSGVCRPFDENADGTVPGSGQFVYLIKRLDDAINENDNILGEVNEVNVNNDGKNKASYTAPSFDGQVDVINQFYKKRNIDKGSIDYLETHGTATKLGDAIEISSITETFPQKINIGSTKSNFGHLDTSSGFLSIYKALDMLEKQYIPPIANFTEISSLVKELSIKIPKEGINAPVKKIAINSFGIGGTNAHVVIEKYNDNREWMSKWEEDIKYIRNKKIKFPIYTKIKENLDEQSQKYTKSLVTEVLENKLRLIRTLLLDQKSDTNSKWFEYDFNTNECVELNNDVQITNDDKTLFSKIPKLHIESENINVNNVKNKKIPVNRDKKDDIWGLFEKFTSLQKDYVEDKKVTDIDVDSFILIELIDEIGLLLNRDISFDFFMNYKGTVTDFILEITDNDYLSDSGNINILQKQYHKNKENIILFHPAGGMTSPYKEMMAEASSDFNIILVSYPKKLISDQNTVSISRLADIYIHQLKNKNMLGGSLIVGGYSFGGNLAYEVARKLPATSIHKVLLIDSHPFNAYITKQNIPDESYNKAMDILIKQEPSFEHTGAGTEDMKLIWKQNHKMLKNYEVDILNEVDTKAILFRCKEPENNDILKILDIKGTDKTNWGPLFNEFKIIDIPGNHYSIFSNGNLIKTIGKKIIENLN